MPKEKDPYDLKLSLSEVNKKNWKEIEKLSPFGLGNPKPLFLFEKVKVEKIKKFGKNGGEHLEILFSDATGKANAIAFFKEEDSFRAHVFPGAYVDLFANFDLSRFRGREEIRLRVVDIF